MGGRKYLTLVGLKKIGPSNTNATILMAAREEAHKRFKEAAEDKREECLFEIRCMRDIVEEYHEINDTLVSGGLVDDRKDLEDRRAALLTQAKTFPHELGIMAEHLTWDDKTCQDVSEFWQSLYQAIGYEDPPEGWGDEADPGYQ